jgi:ubiquinone/menaquinone biosynthesis C-methylase UbiE
MDRALAEQRRRFGSRCREYLRLGHDLFAAARFVAGFAAEGTSTVLDVGTGKGIFAIELARKGVQVVSIDPDDSDRALAVLLAEEAGVQKSISLVRGDGAGLPFPSGSFGCVAMVEVLHHLHDLPPVSRELGRVLRPGGTLVVADFSEPGFDLVAQVHRREGGEHLVSGVTLEHAVAQFEEDDLACTGRHEGRMLRVATFTNQTSGLREVVSRENDVRTD